MFLNLKKALDRKDREMTKTLESADKILKAILKIFLIT